MPAVMTSFKRIWKKAAVLGAVGIAISILRMTTSVMAPGAFLSDTFFTIGSLFLCAGLIGLVKNLGVFNSMKYGTRLLIDFFRGKRKEPEDKMKGGYYEYVQSRPKTKDVPMLMALAAICVILSVLVSLPLL